MSNALPDALQDDLIVIFCGTAAGTISAATQSYYAHPQNQFWKALAQTGMTKTQLKPTQFKELNASGIGFTDISKSHVGMDKGLRLTATDIQAFENKIKRHHPRIVAFTSKKAASLYFAEHTKNLDYGTCKKKIEDTELFILPSPSPAATRSWNMDHWQALAKRYLEIRKEK